MFREIAQQGLDIQVVTETWLKNNNEDMEWPKSTLLVNEPFQLYHANRENGTDGALPLSVDLYSK